MGDCDVNTLISQRKLNADWKYSIRKCVWFCENPLSFCQFLNIAPIRGRVLRSKAMEILIYGKMMKARYSHKETALRHWRVNSTDTIHETKSPFQIKFKGQSTRYELFQSFAEEKNTITMLCLKTSSPPIKNMFCYNNQFPQKVSLTR